MTEAENYLPDVRRAVRTKSTAYDEELLIYIQYVLDELVRVGVKDAEDTEMKAGYKNLILPYVKANFGNADPNTKQLWAVVYDRLFHSLVV